jgi:hypothetical protein
LDNSGTGGAVSNDANDKGAQEGEMEVFVDRGVILAFIERVRGLRSRWPAGASSGCDRSESDGSHENKNPPVLHWQLADKTCEQMVLTHSRQAVHLLLLELYMPSLVRSTRIDGLNQRNYYLISKWNSLCVIIISLSQCAPSSKAAFCFSFRNPGLSRVSLGR